MRSMRRLAPLTLLLVLSVAAVAAGHGLDHPPPSFTAPAGPLSSQVNAGGDEAEWELLTTIPTGNPHSDLDFFTRGGDTYMSAGTLGIGPNAGGQNIFRLTEGGAVDPSYVGAHPSAACPGIFTAATGLQHDVEATPKGDAFQMQPNLHIARGDAQLLVDSTDGSGRCHDNGAVGLPGVSVQGNQVTPPPPNGGLEIIDITNIEEPKELALITHIGNAHTVNVDPKRPHIAFDITQDGVTINAEGRRTNEIEGSTSNALDGFEVIDMSSCMNFAPDTSLEAKRASCKPEVFRYRYPDAAIARSHTFRDSLQGCHEVEIYPDDKLTCASITATAIFDLSNAFNDNGTPDDYTDDKPRGEPLPCKVRESTSPAAGGLKTGAPVIDCVNGERNGQPQHLRVSEWMKIDAPSLRGVEWVGTIPHMGFRVGDTASIVDNPHDATKDLVAAHESEFTESGNFVISSDERGGGVVPGGASCNNENAPDYTRGNGGLHFFPTANFSTRPPEDAAGSQALWAKTPEGKQAIFRAPIKTPPQGTICTAHVFQLIPGQNRIFMGYYSQGTRVMDFTEHEDGTVSFKHAGWFIPENANTWVSHIFKAQQNQDGSFTYWGAASDGILPGAGRSAIDVYKVTLPPPPIPRGGPKPGSPKLPISTVRGVENERAAQVTAAGGCASTSVFEHVAAQPRGRGLAFSFRRRGTGSVVVDLFRSSRGRRVDDGYVRRFVNRSGSFRWNGRRGRSGRKVRDGFYHARFQTRNTGGGKDTRRVALRRRKGKWSVRPVFYRRTPCQLAEAFKLSRPVFGGRKRTPLGISFRLNQEANVAITVRQGGRVVARIPGRSYVAGRTIRLRLSAGRVPRRGDVRITMRATRTGRALTQSIFARKL